MMVSIHPKCRAMGRVGSPIAAVLLMLASLFTGSNSCADEVHAMNTAEGVVLVSLTGRLPADASIQAQDGRLAFTYRRGTYPILFHHRSMMTGLERLTVRLRSSRAGQILLALEDRDGDKFNTTVRVEKNTWQDITLRPADFTPDKDHVNRKAQIDPERLGSGFALVDVSFSLRGTMNTIEIDTITVDHGELPERTGPMIVTGRQELTDNVRLTGPITIESGGELRITADRVAIAGDVTIKGGTLEIIGGTLHLVSRFTHERHWRIEGQGRVSARNAHLKLDHGVEVETWNRARFALIETRTNGVFTVTAHDRAQTLLQDAEGSGEFILCGTCPFRAERADFFLLWLVLGPDYRGTLALPDGTAVRQWSPGQAWDVTVTESSNVLWGLITAPGADATIKNSKLIAVASVFAGPGETLVRAIHTGRLPDGGLFQVGNRTLRFQDSTVAAWNVYTTMGHHLVLEDSTVGEAWGLDGTGSLTIRRSTIDGSGGTLRARGSTRMRIENSRVVPQVIAQDDARMDFVDSTVENTISATDRAIVTLKNTPVSGALQASPPARIERR